MYIIPTMVNITIHIYSTFLTLLILTLLYVEKKVLET